MGTSFVPFEYFVMPRNATLSVQTARRQRHSPNLPVDHRDKPQSSRRAIQSGQSRCAEDAVESEMRLH
jgi:hypothetical protein